MSKDLKGRHVRIIQGMSMVASGRLGEIIDQSGDDSILVKIANQPGWKPQWLSMKNVELIDVKEYQQLKQKLYVKHGNICVCCGRHENVMDFGYRLTVRRPPQRGCKDHPQIHEAVDIHVVFCKTCQSTIKSALGWDGDRLPNTLVQLEISKG